VDQLLNYGLDEKKYHGRYITDVVTHCIFALLSYNLIFCYNWRPRRVSS